MSTLLDSARKSHQAGDFARAEQLYQQVLQSDPGNADVWQMLGTACLGLGKKAEAVANYQHVLRLRPESADAHFRLGGLLADQAKRDEAIESYRAALRIQPGHAEALTGLGVVLAQVGKLDEAEKNLREAAQRQPDLAKAHHNLGVVLAERRNLEEAVLSFKNAIRLKPDYAEVYVNMGLALNQLGKSGEAVVALRQATRLLPNSAEAFNNLGLSLADLGRFAEAEAAYQEALRLNPQHVAVHTNLGSMYDGQSKLEEAIASYQMALWLDPEQPITHWNRSLAWLRMGDFARGWPEYEWRWKKKGMPPRTFHQPLWDGSPLAGRTILLHVEQGVGDVIQLVRYGKLLQDRGGRIVVECPNLLVRLFQRCHGIEQVVEEGKPLPHFDVHAPLMSLPKLVRTTVETIPADIPYLFADEQRVDFWRSQLPPGDILKVGIAWQGNPKHVGDRHRSVRLTSLAPIAEVPGVQLFSLQKGPGSEQLAQLNGQFTVTNLGSESWPDFMETAAVVANLDLVITVDTAVAHLAGALGKPVWVAIPYISDWRWLRGREDSPWYPTMRLFRQKSFGDWESVFVRMAGELRKLLENATSMGPIPPAELIDRIAFLEVGEEQSTGAEDLVGVNRELTALIEQRRKCIPSSDKLAELTVALKVANREVHQIEADLHACERAEDFGSRFVELSRAMLRHQGERKRLKQQINDLLHVSRREGISKLF
jgi:Flp pilus assembly protein TadD